VIDRGPQGARRLRRPDLAMSSFERPNPCTTVAELCAIHEIQQLAHLYAYAHDARDPALLMSLWSRPDEHARYPAIDIHSIERHIGRWFHRGPTILFVGNHLIRLQDTDRAEGRVYCLAQLDTGEQLIDQSILYDDRYVREDGRWLFETRRHLLWYGARRAGNPFRQPPADWPRSQIGAGIAAAEIEVAG
jgi:SnoaL-like protein